MVNINTRCGSRPVLTAVFCAVCVWAAGASRSTVAAGIVPDGGTATNVAIGQNGREIVNIAPAVAGVSQNTYARFDVGSAGATLNNVGINARTIVNQVTSTNPSVIMGEVAVAGPRANVVLANPNGITVNGGSFVNVGHLALSAGQVSFTDLQIAPGVMQRNVNLDTTGGSIVVGPQGLSGALIALDLLARNITVQGPVTNTFSSHTAVTRLTAGASKATIDTGLSPTDNGHEWLHLSPPAQARTGDRYAIDITAAGSLSSGRIELIVTDKGPGVRSAGELNAIYGDFVLTSNGSVQIADSTLTAANGISIHAKDAVALRHANVRANGGGLTIAATGDLEISETNALANGAAVLDGASVTMQNRGSDTTTLASANSGVLIHSAGDIVNLNNLVQGSKRIEENSTSAGAVTLIAAGDVTNRTTAGSQLGILFGQADDVSISAAGSVTNRNARILSNTTVTIAAGGDFSNLVDHIDGVGSGRELTYSHRSPRWLVFSRRESGMRVDYGSLADPERLAYVTADGGDVRISARNVLNRGGSILSNNGAVDIAATDTLRTEAVFTGQASFHRSCVFFCRSRASSTVQAYGGTIQAGGDIALSAGTQIDNVGGTVLAIGRLHLTAPRVVAQGVTGYTAFTRENDMKAWFGNRWATIYRADSGGLFRAGTGKVTIDGVGEIDGGVFMAPDGVSASGGMATLRLPYRTPVTLQNHLGLISWIGL
ncbi:filamentous hemagglutinin N-terminal domain-containing protein [Cupriavidus gilardii]|uniref:filamentous hemagglutinin N-terminal domain-containing protein n=1 Tax=Cupriavidus gilardii TaxID=82541 RepID=UPI001ABE759C|nr:filamentous hemagglutinin N-terminal domain-containing protein [Cupriavidus gilardii]MBO4123217.1 filamentous hemagglutinin N-terminal domain-containing protein [Cupriavidus gilardii]